MNPNNVVRTSDDSTGESTSDNSNEGVNDIISKILDLIGYRSTWGSVADIADDATDCSEITIDEIEGRKNKNNRNTTDTSKIKENEIRIPAVETSHLIAQTVDKAWARELFEIRREKREAILEELHGVQSRAVPETQETIRSGLVAMDVEINNVASSSVSGSSRKLVEGHLKATETFQSKYVTAPEFRLRFLRTEFFDYKKAARRYFTCLNYLLKYFGDFALLRPLQMSDLSSSQRRYLESGKYQVLLNRDRMGRRIQMAFGTTTTGTSYYDRCRVEDYIEFGVMAEDDETQLHGATSVVIFHPHGGPNSDDNDEDGDNEKSVNINSGGVEELEQSSNAGVNDPNWDEREKKILKRMLRTYMDAPHRYVERSGATPIRWSSIHLCLPDTRVFHFLKAIVLGMIPSKYRSVTKVHTGSLLECTYEMTQFGIPAEDLGTTIKSKSLAKFLRARASVESFRKDFCAEHGVEYYRAWHRLQHGQRQDQQQTTIKQESQTTAISEPAELPYETDFGQLTEDFCPGTDCPASNYVVFGDRITYKYPGNVAFREYMREFLRTKIAAEDDEDHGNTRKNKASMRLKTNILDQIIDETCVVSGPVTFTASAKSASADDRDSSFPSTKHFMFAMYDKKIGWYRYMLPFQNENDRIELRKRISQTMRDDRKRIMKNSNNRNIPDSVSSTTAASNISTTFQNTDGDSETFGAKRLKTNVNDRFDVFCPCAGEWSKKWVCFLRNASRFNTEAGGHPQNSSPSYVKKRLGRRNDDLFVPVFHCLPERRRGCFYSCAACNVDDMVFSRLFRILLLPERAFKRADNSCGCTSWLRWDPDLLLNKNCVSRQLGRAIYIR